jgi:hypothetical protein
MPESYMYSGDQRSLTGRLREELDALLGEYGARWHVVGPGPDGGWYAWPRDDDEAPRVFAPSLTELGGNLKEATG